MHNSLQNFPYTNSSSDVRNQENNAVRHCVSKDPIPTDTIDEDHDPLTSLREYQEIVARMCRNILSRIEIINKKFRDLKNDGIQVPSWIEQWYKAYVRTYQMWEPTSNYENLLDSQTIKKKVPTTAWVWL